MKRSNKIYTTRAWRVTRKEILERDGYRCTIGMEGCTGEATQVDHIHPLAFGGDPYSANNLRGACANCNSSRANKLRRKPSRQW